MRPLAFAVALCSLAACALASPESALTPPPNHPRTAEPDRFAITNATVHPRPGETSPATTIFIEGTTITRVARPTDADAVILDGWRVIDATGLHVYPAFIDAYVEVDAPKPDKDSPDAHWNPMVTPQRTALDGAGLGAGKAESLRKLGFGAAGIVPRGGVFRGTTAVVSTGARPSDPSAARPTVYADHVAQAMGFDRVGWDERGYPSSVMGAVALQRQVLSDADWQLATGTDTPNALTPLEDTSVPLLIDAGHELQDLLADKVAREFGRDLIIYGTGTEYQRLDAVAGTGRRIIVPLRFPAKPDVSSVGAADAVDLETLMAWEQAPTNPRRLADSELTVAITASDLPKGADFDANLRRAVDEGGLTPHDALAMLTTNPAQILGVADQLGTIEPGKRANLLLTSAPLFDKKTERRELWVDGTRYRLTPDTDTGLDGDWTLRVGPKDHPFFTMEFEIKAQKITIEHEQNADDADDDAHDNTDEGEHNPTKLKARDVRVTKTSISFVVDDPDDAAEGEQGHTYILSGVVNADGSLKGTGVAPDQSAFQWTAQREPDDADNPDAKPDDDKSKRDQDEDDEDDKPADLPPEDLGGYPFGPYAVHDIPDQGAVLLTNATLWTSGPDGILEHAWIQLVDGKIRAIGTGPVRVLSPEPSTTIDCTGKHITPGIIDCHSHTGLFMGGVNEGGQAVTAECRIHDSLDPGHINFYRQLAGGTTTVNSLHGSANPIGGQNAIHKIRWGAPSPDDFLLDGAKPGIKFALGENVKQSNWHNDRSRYPQTRMGVETLIRDRFTAARDYAKAMHAPEVNALRKRLDALLASRKTLEAARREHPSVPARPDLDNQIELTRSKLRAATPRRDLELEALAQILAGDRLVHCHSYRQDEILMLCRVAEDFGFKIGTFQHGLEVYKVAEVVRKDAIGASLFSDWWAYKVEVQDAIPYAGPLQTEAGVLTSYNSDDDELARRLNLEAAKAVKYSGGRISPEEALKFVTINPAKQLMIDDRVGSLEVGKDADVVVWSADPLSVYAKPERVYVDGRERFSLEQDAAMRERNRAQRQRLIQKILAAPDRAEDKPRKNAEDHGDKGTDPVGTDAPPSLLARINSAMHDPDQPTVCNCNIRGCAEDEK